MIWTDGKGISFVDDMFCNPVINGFPDRTRCFFSDWLMCQSHQLIFFYQNEIAFLCSGNLHCCIDNFRSQFVDINC